MVRIRPIAAADAERYTLLLRDLDAESRFPVVSAMDRVMGSDQWHAYIMRMKAQGRAEYFVAETGGELIGFLSTSEAGPSIVWQLRIVIGLRAAWQGQGIGTQLFVAMESWAREAGVQRLDLLVEANNTQAFALYRKMGFVVEGVIERAVFIDGQLVDDLVMAKWLDA